MPPPIDALCVGLILIPVKIPSRYGLASQNCNKLRPTGLKFFFGGISSPLLQVTPLSSLVQITSDRQCLRRFCNC